VWISLNKLLTDFFLTPAASSKWDSSNMMSLSVQPRASNIVIKYTLIKSLISETI
jgi:hypothetical protein